jgi:hypothetical protein
MKRVVSEILIWCLMLIALAPPAPLANAAVTSDAGNAYGLGVSMGLASFQAAAGKDWSLVADAIGQIRKFGDSLKGVAPGLNTAELSKLGNQLRQSQITIHEVYPPIVTARGEFQQILQQVSQQLGNAYDLGVAISIAEAQATAGEAARGIVRSSLASAQHSAISLGIPAKELAGIIAQIDQGVALNSIYGQISYLRGKYQSLLSALQPVIPGPKIATGKGAPVDADTVLLKRGCTRPAPGAYSCPTISAYEACESYRNQGVVKACATSANEKVQAAMDKLLFSVGCSRFLGRADEFTCKTQKGLDLCETYHKNGKLKKCVMAK